MLNREDFRSLNSAKKIWNKFLNPYGLICRSIAIIIYIILDFANAVTTAQYVVLLKWQSQFSQKTLFSKKGFNYFIDEGYGCVFAESFRVWLLDPMYKKGTK